jgi:hypothetical protein
MRGPILCGSNIRCVTTRQMACFNDTHNWQTIPHRNFSYHYSGLVTKAIDGVPTRLLGDILAPPFAISLTSWPPTLPNPSSGNRQMAYVSCNSSFEPSALSHGFQNVTSKRRQQRSHDSSVGIATRLRAGRSGF